MVVFDITPDAIAKLIRSYPDIASAPLAEAAAQDIVFLAVHPPAIGNVLPEIKLALKPGIILVSLAPKFTIAKLSDLLGGFQRIARMIPNAPSIVGKGIQPHGVR